MDKDAEVPNVTSAFSIAAGDALSDPVNGIHCYAGVGEPVFVADGTNSVTVGADKKAVVTFGPTDTTTAEASVGTKTVAFMTGTDTTDEKFVTKTLTVSFAGIKFPEPGLYRYIITEAMPTDGGVSIPTGHDRVYTLFVAVEDNNGTLEVASTKYVLQEGTDAPTITTETVPGATEGETTTVTVNANKKTGMSNWYDTNDLSFDKIVEGNQGSRDKYFKFTVKLTEPEGSTAMSAARDNDRFIVKGSFEADPTLNDATKAEYKTPAEGATDTPMKIANGNELTQVGEGTAAYQYVTYAQLKAGKVFYIQNGQNVEIYGIPAGLGYEIEEVKEDYTAAVNVHSGTDLDSDGTASTDNTKVTDANLEKSASLTFTNTKEGVIPTGVILSTALPIAAVVIGAAGAAGCVVYFRKKSEEE